MSKMLKEKVLVLNSSMEFLGISNVRDAIKDLINGNVTVLESYEYVIKGGYNKRGERSEMFAPSVVMVVDYVHVKYEELFKVSYSPENVKLRDRFVCQYCNKKFRSDDLNIDHVHPKSLGGKLTWENSVAACYDCNTKKDDNLLHECGFSLRKLPVKPTGFSEYIRIKIQKFPETWEEYIY